MALGSVLVAGDAAALCVAGVAGVALGDVHLRIVRQAWRNLISTVVLRVRRGEEDDDIEKKDDDDGDENENFDEGDERMIILMLRKMRNFEDDEV